MEQRTTRHWSTAPGPHARHRLVIEDASPAYRLADFDAFTDAGFDVAWCSGPDHDACPLVATGQCELAGAADVVLFGLDLDEADARAVLRAHDDMARDRPVVLEVPRQRMGAHEELTDGKRVLPFPASVRSQVFVVTDALSASRPATGGAGRA